MQEAIDARYETTSLGFIEKDELNERAPGF
jgi:hypothetical protein